MNKSTSRIDFELQRVKLMIKEAQDADVAGCKNIAIMLYADSVQVAINIVSLKSQNFKFCLKEIF